VANGSYFVAKSSLTTRITGVTYGIIQRTKIPKKIHSKSHNKNSLQNRGSSVILPLHTLEVCMLL
jgi:hypothetical protein